MDEANELAYLGVLVEDEFVEVCVGAEKTGGFGFEGSIRL